MTDEVAATPEQGPVSHEEAGVMFAKLIGEGPEATQSELQEEPSANADLGHPETEPELEMLDSTEEVAEEAPTEAEPAEEVVEAEPESESAELPGTIEELATTLDLSKDDLTSLTVNVTQNGKPVQVKLSDAIDGHLRLTDYKQKTSALADEKRSFSEERDSFSNERQAQVNALAEMFQHFRNGFLGAPPDKAMLNENDLDRYDPSRYMAQKEQWETRARKFTADQRSILQMQQMGQQESDAQVEQRVAAEYVKLVDRQPSWGNKAKFLEVQKDVNDAMHRAGFNDEEMGQLRDHRMFEVAWKAAEYDRIHEGAEAKKVSKRIPKFSKPGKMPAPRSANQVSKSATVAQLRKTGSLDDAAAAFTASINRSK
mgnify:CR=1 FL=1